MASTAAPAFSGMSLGAFFECSLSPSASGPGPIDVKESMAHRAFLGSAPVVNIPSGALPPGP